MSNDLILIGGGGHCRSVIDVVETAGMNILGIFDRRERIGEKVLGYEIIGCDEDVADFVDRADFIVTVGSIKDPQARIRCYERVKAVGGHVATLISPLAHVSAHAEVGEGTVVLHAAVINASARVGCNCIINTGAVIEHDCHVGDHTHISTHATLNGGAEVGNCAFIGSGAVLRQGAKVCDDAIVGAASLVVKDIITPGIYYGIPAEKR